MKKVNSSLNTLIEIMNELREKCPWDKKQTTESLREKTIEISIKINISALDSSTLIANQSNVLLLVLVI